MVWNASRQRRKMRVYIAAPWKDRELARYTAAHVVAAGHSITHNWWDVEGEYADHEAMLACAKQDVVGVILADKVVLIDSQKSEGKAVEQGIAIAMNKPILAIGERGAHSQNVFHHLANYQWYPTVEEAIAAIGG
jgi:hypothetical protein